MRDLGCLLSVTAAFVLTGGLVFGAEPGNLLADPSVKPIASFERGNPFSAGTVVELHATAGRKALRIERSFVSMDERQNWVGYDFLKADLWTDAPKPVNLDVEVRDTQTRDYWTRVNYSTVVPPGKSTLVIPVKQLYVGEKSRPGRMLNLGAITRLVFNIGERPAAALFLDNLRLERDDSFARASFEGLHAYDFGTSASPVMEGFTPVTPATAYSRGRGYGLKDARIWRAFDALQPEPLYQDFICIEAGGLAVDLPNGKYHVFVNIDSPSGFWGEYQKFRGRAIRAEGRPVVQETMDFEAFKARYFRFWKLDDLPTDVTFDKYQKPYFQEKQFDVDVTDGQLNLEFEGANWSCCVSAVVIFPVQKATEGEAFLKQVEARRRFYFDNGYKRVLPAPTGDPLVPSEADRRRGFVVFERDVMRDVSYNDTPWKEEARDVVHGDAFAGECEPVTLALVPLRDLGNVSVIAGDLTGPAGTIPGAAIDSGYVSYRLSRVTSDGAVYTISPRLIMPGAVVNMPQGITRRFWLTVRTPPDAKPGAYKGTITIRTQEGEASLVALEFRVRAGGLDPVDIPSGPFGYTIGIPWFGDDPGTARYNQQMLAQSLQKLREHGFTACSGLPSISYRGFREGKPVLDFRAADRAMALAKEQGFLAVVSYGGGVSGLDAYHRDPSAMTAAGFQDYASFVKAIYSQVQEHAQQNGWIPVYYNLADEPIGDELVRAAENAEAYRQAFPQGPPYFTGASSFRGSDSRNPHFRLAKALHVVSWNDHDEAAVRLIHDAGADWAFYNGGNRWSYGTYMYKAAKQYGMKFRLSWHWNVVAGDPFYALDCREDDYAWCNSSPDGQLIPSVEFERLREGLDDYRRLITLERLASEHQVAPAAQAARQLIATRMGAFKLGQRNHDALFGPGDWMSFRRQVDDLIEALRFSTQAQERTSRGGRVNQLKVLSDKIDDVTTVENIVHSFARPGMSDQERARALWTAVVKYRHQTTAPNEHLAGDWETHDPVKIFNVYGYCICCCTSALVAALNREDGREARGRILNGHSVPEVRYRDGWHMFDGSLINFFPRPADGVAASVDEITAAVADWYGGHPGYQKNGTRIMQLMRKDNWTGWKVEGPPLLANCPFYRMGYFPARTHGWDGTMAEYDRKSEVYEYGYHVGHRALFSLRPGESFVREAGNRGLHVNMDVDPNRAGLKARAPERDLVYVNEFLPGYRGGVAASGILRYAPNLGAGDLALGAEVFDNLASGGSPALHVQDRGRAGVAVVPMVSPYVYLGGRLRLKATGRLAGDRLTVAISTNNGHSFTEIHSAPLAGETEVEIDLKDKILRRYAYWLRLELTGAAGLDRFEVESDFQHAPRTLPWLVTGKNTITVAADGDPGIATRSIACRITPDSSFNKNETTATMGVVFDNVDLRSSACWWKGGTGVMTVPIEVPGDLVALGFSAQFRARGERDRIRVSTSTDDGRTWRDVATLTGPTPGRTEHIRVPEWPPQTRKALLRFEMTGNNTVGVMSFRVDADYRDPLAAPTARPFRVVHRWQEAGQARSHSETINRLPARYEIEAGPVPEMVSVSYEMPATQ
jgi:hypothetical protein